MLKYIVILSALIISGCISSIKAQCPWPPHGGDNYPIIPPIPKPYPGDEANPDGMLSYDPNELLGPTGVDSLKMIRSLPRLMHRKLMCDSTSPTRS